MSKRLEEIKGRYNNLLRLANVPFGHKDKPPLKFVLENDLEWLIEQAERVQELESHITKMAVARYKDSEELDDIHKQNKRYREVLERISKHDAYEIDIFVAGKMADEALEGDPHESS